MPTHVRPSPPIWLASMVPGRANIAMPWQPMPAMPWLPSGTTVLVLCGQPEQKKGVRLASAGAITASSVRRAACSACTRCCSSSSPAPSDCSRAAMVRPSSMASKPTSAFSSGRPASSALPVMRGRTGWL